MTLDELSLKQAEKLHDEAILFLVEAILAKHEKKYNDEKTFKEKAFNKELAAAKLLEDTEIEPSRAILFRSAANLALIIGRFNDCVNLCDVGLNSKITHNWIKNELINLKERANKLIEGSKNDNLT